VAFQDSLKSLVSRSAAPGEILKRCDAVRDVDFVQLGVRLEDRGNDGYVWYFDDRHAIEAEQKEAEEKANEAVKGKIRNKLEQSTKELKVAEKAAVEPKALFQSGAYAGTFSDFDAEGMPSKQASGEDLSAKKKKDLAKELAKQQKDYEKLSADLAAQQKANTKAKSEAETEKANAEDAHQKAEKKLGGAEEDLANVQQTTKDLHARCDFLMANFEDRATKREQEISGLQNAKATLSGASM